MGLFTKIMLIFEHHICTMYSISENYYRGEENPMARTCQSNRFSGDFYRDTLGLVIRVLEKQELGMIIQSPITNEQIQALAVGFVNDIDFNSDGKNVQ